MTRREERYQQELEEIDQMKRDGEIRLETWELMRDNLDMNYPEEDPEEADEYPLDLSDYPETFDWEVIRNGIFGRIFRRCAVRYNSTDGICRLLCG